MDNRLFREVIAILAVAGATLIIIQLIRNRQGREEESDEEEGQSEG